MSLDDLDTTPYVPTSEHTRKLAEVRLSKQRALQACEAELSGLRAAAQEALRWIDGEAEGEPSWCGERAMREYERRRETVAGFLRAALNPKESA